MAKNTDSKSKWKRDEKFKQENDKLRKEVSRLRKQAKNSFIENLEQKLDKEEESPIKLHICENCGNPGVAIISLERKDGDWEIKICKLCQHKTDMKKKKG